MVQEIEEERQVLWVASITIGLAQIIMREGWGNKPYFWMTMCNFAGKNLTIIL